MPDLPLPLPTVLYDGHCVFCRRSVQRLQRWTPPGRFAWVSFREEGVLEGLPQVSAPECEKALQLVTVEGEVLAGMAAVVEVLKVRWWGSILRWIYLLPGIGIILDAVYTFIARNRFRIAGRDACEGGTCGIHPPP